MPDGRSEEDARCIRWGHHVRRIQCSNPTCPSRRPDLWGEALRMLEARQSLERPSEEPDVLDTRAPAAREQASARDLEPDEADERCVRWGHHVRQVRHCTNPNCPSLRPDLWGPMIAMLRAKEGR